MLVYLSGEMVKWCIFGTRKAHTQLRVKNDAAGCEYSRRFHTVEVAELLLQISVKLLAPVKLLWD